MKIIDYLIITERNTGAFSDVQHVPLDERVRLWINNGYQPFGSPFVGPTGLTSQAVVKYEEQP